jgi:HPt (histidine-containing phosphotransfer) domain-containing protein
MAVDPSTLEMLKEVIGDDLKEIVEAYQATLPELLCQINEGIDSQDASAVQLHSHTLKGSSANIGANDLSEMCLQLEMEAKKGEVTDQFKAISEQIHQEAKVVADFVTNFLNNF